jgi:hypothetical protein
VSTHITSQDDLQDTAAHRLDVMDTQHNDGRTATKHDGLPTSLVAGKDKANNTTITTRSQSPTGLKSSPSVTVKETTMEIDMPDAPHEDVDVKSDSEAETIVLPGKVDKTRRQK